MLPSSTFDQFTSNYTVRSAMININISVPRWYCLNGDLWSCVIATLSAYIKTHSRDSLASDLADFILVLCYVCQRIAELMNSGLMRSLHFCTNSIALISYRILLINYMWKDVFIWEFLDTKHVFPVVIRETFTQTDLYRVTLLVK